MFILLILPQAPNIARPDGITQRLRKSTACNTHAGFPALLGQLIDDIRFVGDFRSLASPPQTSHSDRRDT